MYLYTATARASWQERLHKTSRHQAGRTAGHGVGRSHGVGRFLPSVTHFALALITATAISWAPSTWAVVMPPDETADLQRLVRTDPLLQPTVEIEPIENVASLMENSARFAWSDFIGSRNAPELWHAHIDRRNGLIDIAEGEGMPWIPGRGNPLTVRDIAAHLRGQSRPDLATLESIARSFLDNAGPMLGSDSYKLRLNLEASGQYSDYFWLVDFDVYAGGVQIEGASIFFRVNHGNLVQFGAEKVPAPGTEVPAARYGLEEARRAVERYAGLLTGSEWFIDRGSLRLHPVPAGRVQQGFSFGRGYELAPMWEFSFRRGDEHPTWRARVDAVTGDVVELIDVNRYSQVTGGYWPVAWRVNGATVNQVSTGWPFTAVNPLGATSNTSGLYSWDGNPQTAFHTGPFVNISDSCTGAAGTAASDGNGDIDFGSFNPPDPNTPGDCTTQLGIGDNTPAARQQFWHVNKIKEKARSYFPTNTWLQQQLTVNVNINLTCNAFWNGSTLNFYRTNGGCFNLGANAGVSMHEWGHGMDSNDGNGSSTDNGTGETYGDFSGALQTLNSCIGNGILGGVCGGYGNACVPGGCDGIRDIDWGRHVNNVPMTVASFTGPLCPSDGGGGYVGPCGLGQGVPNDKEGHCESLVSSGALYDLGAFDLQAGCGARNGAFADWNCPGAGGPYNSAGAWGVTDRLWYLSRPMANQAFTCNIGALTSNGCNAGSNWKTMRAIDDDDGNLANGTPHSCQLAAAFDRHGIACTTDPAYNVCFRGCPQPAAPTLNPPGVGNNQLTLTWTPDTTPDVVDIFRNEAGCGFGFSKIAEDVTFGSLPYIDNSVANGTTYYYQVVRHPTGIESCGSAPSNCVAATPASGPSAKYVTDSATLTAVPTDNDTDGFVDNCETGRIQVGIVNDGSGALTNARFTVTSPDAAVTITTGMPVNVGSLAVSTQTTGTFDFDLDGATCGQTLNFSISVTADEMTGSNPDSFTHGSVEQDLTLTAGRTDDFETDNDGWTFSQGYARENVTADSGVWSVHSSSGLDDQNDVATSPIFQRGVGVTQVVIAERHDIEAPFWDRANVHAVRLSDNTHTLLTPTGSTYTVGTWNDIGHVGVQDGWAGIDLTWGDATFDLSGLTVGEGYVLEINYNTDGAVVGTGHWFDNVRWTNVTFQGCDAQSDLCTPCTPPATPTGLTATADAANQIRLDWNAVAPAPTNYRIYRSTTPGGPYTQVGTVGGGTLTYTDSGLTDGVTYYYVVRAFDLCESADSNETSATAFGDCTAAPTFGGITSVAPISAGGSCGLRLEWSAGTNNCGGDPLVYNVYRSTTSGFTPGAGNLLQSCVTNPFLDDTSVASGTTTYYVVRAEDDAGNGGGICQNGNEDSGVSELSGSVGGSGTTVVFEDDFDGTQSPADLWAFGFNLGSPGGGCPATYNDLWYRPETGFCSGNTAASNDQAAGPAYGIYVNGAMILGQPPSGGPPFTDGGLVLPATATSITLTFNHDYDFEGPDWDGGRLLVSADNWPTFTVVTPVGGYPGTVRNSTFFCHPWPGGSAYIGDSGGCTAATFDLTAFAGQRVWIAWNHGADDFVTGDDGWSIDDVRIEAQTPASCTVAPAAPQFLTATATDTQNELEWLNPSAGGYGSTMIRWATGGYPADPTDGTLLVDQNDGLGAKGTFTHGGLTNDATYYYSAFVDNGSGEFSARKTVSARPFDTSGPVTWAYSTGASTLSPPGIGSVYGVSNDRVLHSMDTDSSSGTWPGSWQPLAMNGPAQSRPPVLPIALGGASKVTFLGSQDGRVYAVDADTGAQLWSSPDLPPVGGLVQGAPAGSFAAFGGLDLILAATRHSSADNQVHGLNLANGTIAWSFTNSVAQGGDDSGIGIISSGPTLDPVTNRLYFASRARSGGSSNTVWCISINGSGATLLWARALGDVDSSPILYAGKIYVGSNNSQVHALDGATGADLWSAPFDANDGPIKGYIFPRFFTDDLLFSTSTRVWSISDDGADASLNFSEASIPSPSIPLVSFSEPVAWIGGGDGRFYELDFTSGSPVLTSLTLGDGSGAIGSPAFDINTSTAYVGTDAGRVFAVSIPLP